MQSVLRVLDNRLPQRLPNLSITSVRNQVLNFDFDVDYSSSQTKTMVVNYTNPFEAFS